MCCGVPRARRQHRACRDGAGAQEGAAIKGELSPSPSEDASGAGAGGTRSRTTDHTSRPPAPPLHPSASPMFCARRSCALRLARGDSCGRGNAQSSSRTRARSLARTLLRETPALPPTVLTIHSSGPAHDDLAAASSL